MTISPYASATDDVLDEIVRQAEARLDAQLTSAIAADQRAMTFAGLLFAGAAALGAFAPSSAANSDSIALLLVGIGLAIGGAFATASARPAAWEYVGNVPSGWLGDIQSGKSLKDSKAEMAAFYDEMIAVNETSIGSAGRFMRTAMRIAFVSVGGGVLFVLLSTLMAGSG